MRRLLFLAPLLAACIDWPLLSRTYGADQGTVDGGGSGVQRGAIATVPPLATGAVTVSAPTGIAAGDMLWLTLFSEQQDATAAAPSGWTLRVEQKDNLYVHAWWYYRFVDPSEPSDYSFTLTGTPELTSAVVVAYRGVQTQNPIDIDASVLITPSTEQFDAPSISITRPDEILLAQFVAEDGAGASWTAPAGMASAAETGVIAVFDGLQLQPGASGIRTAECSNAGEGAVELVALVPR